ncbi:hypothetical protein QVD17_28202 [Tagetes erecta]|uniref:Uncharacterized protein n=1 Tax=Tagetes erecta TaxID=13708 RepID=A0AAD8KCX0_TARER|nr:hypothetical protein QVD17_28202 [Tagetes erecta]
METSKLLTFFTNLYLILFQHINRIFIVAAMAIRSVLVTPIRHLWTLYYPQVAVGEAGIVMPHSTINFMINALLALAEIKAQGVTGFPFQTHPRIIMFSVTSLLLYGLASALELVVYSIMGLDPTSVYAVIAHLGKIASLFILVGSLVFLFYV